MVRKFFPLDKNYLLEGAQLTLREELLSSMLNTVKATHEYLYNPLGIPDRVTLQIRNYRPDNFDALRKFYETLSGVYRYKFGDNQLTFMWDGSDQSERYRTEWREFFTKQVRGFCRNELFIRAILDLTVFNNYSQLAENRMNNFMLQTFEVKIRRGLIKIA